MDQMEVPPSKRIKLDPPHKDIFVLAISQNLRPEYCCFFSLESYTSTSRCSQHLRGDHSDYTNRCNQTISDQPSLRFSDIRISLLRLIFNHQSPNNHAIIAMSAQMNTDSSAGRHMQPLKVCHSNYLSLSVSMMTACAFGSERLRRESPSPNHYELWQGI